MTRLEDLQPTAAVRGILLHHVVTAVYETTIIDNANGSFVASGFEECGQ